MKSETLRLKLGLTDSDFDFYRCAKCQRLITRLDEVKSFSKGSRNPGAICPCGSPKYSPANPRWYEYLLPRVVMFAYYRIRAAV
jgi:DNA-directed RNA polymerase subunit RPC12/RpoP